MSTTSQRQEPSTPGSWTAVPRASEAARRGMAEFARAVVKATLDVVEGAPVMTVLQIDVTSGGEHRELEDLRARLTRLREAFRQEVAP